MKFTQYIYILITYLLVSSCSTTHLSQVKRNPSSLKLNYSCQKLISTIFYANPYNQVYALRKFSYSEAVAEFTSNLARRKSQIKPGSEPFIMTQPHGKPGKTVLILHGFSDSPGTIRAVADMYYKRGYHVVAPLYNDHGLLPEFQKEALLNGSLKKWREDVDLAAAIAKGLSNDENIHVAGYSMGGSLVKDLTIRMPGLVSSITYWAPLFKENGPVYTLGLILFKWFKYGWDKGTTSDIFYQSMSYHMTQEMHRLTRQIKPYVLRQHDDIPTAIFRVDRATETTVDDDIIDRFADVNSIGDNRHFIYENDDVKYKVLHRDATSDVVHLSREVNPAISFFRTRFNSFFNEIE